MLRIKYLGIMMFVFITSFSFAQKSKNLKVYIKPNTVSCTGVTEQECMQVKFCNEKDYSLFYDKIEGFNYEKGFEYKLKVKRTDVANPAADASKYKYTLRKVVSKKAVKVENYYNTKLFLNSINGKKFDNKNVYATIDTNSKTIYGNSGCNRFNVSYNINKKGVLEVKSGMGTLMACDEASMKLESEFMNALQNQNFTVSQVNNIVTLKNQSSNNEISFKILSENDVLTYLDGKKWKLFQLENVGMDYGKAFITLDTKTNKVNGNSGCNNFFGGYIIKDDKISFTQLGMTRMACLDEDKKNTENKLMEILNANDLRFDIADQTFNIYKSDRLVAVFGVSNE